MSTKMRFVTLALALVLAALGWHFGWDRYGWAIGGFIAVILVGLLAATGVDIVRGLRSGFGPGDLDRKGGPYDHLHHRVK